jgi:hypothetical protein
MSVPTSPDALKRIISRVNGQSVFIDSVKLAREMYGLEPRKSPDQGMIARANWAIINFCSNPTPGVEFVEHRDLRRIRIEIRSVNK